MVTDSIRLAPSIAVGVWRYMVGKQKVYHKLEMDGPFSKGDTVINKTFYIPVSDLIIGGSVTI
jgi:hypothetical protein